MKVVLDTNIYISWIREQKYRSFLMDVRTYKYLSPVVIMELWAGAKTKQAARIIEKLQKPYLRTNRIIGLNTEHFITVGHVLSDLPADLATKTKSAGFLNDILIAMSAISIGATLITANKADFRQISRYFPELKTTFV